MPDGPCPDTDPSVETMALEEPAWNTRDCSAGTLPSDLPSDSRLQERKNSLKTKDQGLLSRWGQPGPALSLLFPHLLPQRHLLAPKDPPGLQPGSHGQRQLAPGSPLTCLQAPVL